MPRAVQEVEPLQEFDQHYNRTRFLDETSHGLWLLLQKSRKNKSWLAKRLGHGGRSAVTKAFKGSHNFKLETLADISLALGRAVHLTWGADPHEMRFPIDEAGAESSSGASVLRISHPTGEPNYGKDEQDTEKTDHPRRHEPAVKFKGKHYQSAANEAGHPNHSVRQLPFGTPGRYDGSRYFSVPRSTGVGS